VSCPHSADIEAKLRDMTAASAALEEPGRDVRRRRLVAVVTDPDGDVLGLSQGG